MGNRNHSVSPHHSLISISLLIYPSISLSISGHRPANWALLFLAATARTLANTSSSCPMRDEPGGRGSYPSPALDCDEKDGALEDEEEDEEDEVLKYKAGAAPPSSSSMARSSISRCRLRSSSLMRLCDNPLEGPVSAVFPLSPAKEDEDAYLCVKIEGVAAGFGSDTIDSR